MTAPPSRLTPPETVFAWAGARWAGTSAAALFALDETLGGIVRATTQPLVGQMRLTWWHEALVALDGGEVRAHPVLAALVAAGVPGAAAAAMIDGWEELLDEDLPDTALASYAAARGGTLFTLAGNEHAAPAGAGWALADLAANVSDAALAARIAALARDRLAAALASGWPVAARPLGGLARDALAAVEGRGGAGSPYRAATVLRFRLLGR